MNLLPGNSQPWMVDALCAQADPDVWFSDRGDANSTRKAIKVCLSCPVLESCRDFALPQTGLYGVWGGMSERTRRDGQRKLRRRST